MKDRSWVEGNPRQLYSIAVAWRQDFTVTHEMTTESLRFVLLALKVSVHELY